MLVPLDGSVLSEKAIPSALELALGLDLGVTLVRVVSTVQLAMAGEWPAGYPDVLEEVEDDARAYLATQEEQLRSQGVSLVETQMVRGDAA